MDQNVKPEERELGKPVHCFKKREQAHITKNKLTEQQTIQMEDWP